MGYGMLSVEIKSLIPLCFIRAACLVSHFPGEIMSKAVELVSRMGRIFPTNQ